MEAASQSRTIAQDFGWLVNMLDYTDQVCSVLSNENRDLRPADPGGGYFFSIAEQVMHIADSRWSVLNWIDGNDYSEREFSGKYPGKDAPWTWKEASIEQIISSLEESRKLIDECLAWNSDKVLQSTAGTVKNYEDRLAAAREKGDDTTEIEAAGPSTLGNILMFLAAHEQAHRAAIQMILRTHGHKVVRVA